MPGRGTSDRRCLIQCQAGALLTRAKLASWGYDMGEQGVQCELCAASEDSVAHRLLDCPSVEEVRRQRMPQEALRCMRRQEGSLMVQRGWVGCLPCAATAAEDEVCTLPEECPLLGFEPSDGPVYTDGSCFEGNWGLAARAGYSAVQVDERGVLIRALLAPVPVGCPQTAAFAEHLAAKQIAGHALAPVCIAADCASVIKSMTYGPGYATDYKRPMGGVWRQVQWGNIGEAIKVRAHASRKEAEEEQWLRHWMGNDTADELAKRAAASHRLPMESLQELGRERVLQAGTDADSSGEALLAVEASGRVVPGQSEGGCRTPGEWAGEERRRTSLCLGTTS